MQICSDRSSSSRTPQFVSVNDSEFFILFQSYLKDFPRPVLENTAQRGSDSPQKRPFSKGARIYGGTNGSFLPDDHQGAGNLDLVRLSSPASAERLQPRAKLRTCRPPSEHPDNQINDSERIVRICDAMNVVLEFIRTAKLRDSGLPDLGWDTLKQGQPCNPRSRN